MRVETERTPNAGGLPAQAMIHALDIEKTYDAGAVSVYALRGVSLTVPRGEMVAIMGPSGCGKTTPLNCLSGLDTIDSGQIWIEGTDINALSDRAKSRYRARRMGCRGTWSRRRPFTGTEGLVLFVPWPEVILFAVLAFVFALLMTWWPSRRAASVPIADALRYE